MIRIHIDRVGINANHHAVSDKDVVRSPFWATSTIHSTGPVSAGLFIGQANDRPTKQPLALLHCIRQKSIRSGHCVFRLFSVGRSYGIEYVFYV